MSFNMFFVDFLPKTGEGSSPTINLLDDRKLSDKFGGEPRV